MNQANAIEGVILAAGRGTRMAQLPTGLPKPAFPVLGKPIAYHQLELMARLGIRKAHIVVGYRGFELVREIERLPNPGVTIHYVEQREALGIAHCVGLLEPILEHPFLLFLGDIYLEAPKFHEIIETFERGDADAVIAAIQEASPEAIRRNFAIVEGADGLIRRVIEKPRHALSRLKGVGVYLFSPLVFDAIRRTPRTAMRDEYEITDSIQIMVDDGHRVRASACVEADINVTEPRDLLDLNVRLLRASGQQCLVADGTTLPADVRIRDSIIGKGATIGSGVELSQSLVFPGATVPDGSKIERAIVTERAICPVH